MHMHSQLEKDSPARYAWYSVAASLLTLGMKFGAWAMTDSVGLLSDAGETVINLAAGLMALAALSIAVRPADNDHAYGHGKAEYFSSGVEGVLIIIAAVGIAWAAFDRFMHPRPLTSLGPGLLLAVGSSFVNFATARIMLKAAERFDSITLEADARHLLTDVWTSLGMVAGLGLILIFPEYTIIDPVIATIMAANIVWTGIQLVKRSVNGLMDDALPQEELEVIADAIHLHVGDDAIFHGLRTRKAGPNRFIDFHLLLPGDTSVKGSHDLCCDIEETIKKSLPRCQITIHVEPLEDGVSFDGRETGGTCQQVLREGEDGCEDCQHATEKGICNKPNG